LFAKETGIHAFRTCLQLPADGASNPKKRATTVFDIMGNSAKLYDFNFYSRFFLDFANRTLQYRLTVIQVTAWQFPTSVWVSFQKDVI